MKPFNFLFIFLVGFLIVSCEGDSGTRFLKLQEGFVTNNWRNAQRETTFKILRPSLEVLEQINPAFMSKNNMEIAGKLRDFQEENIQNIYIRFVDLQTRQEIYIFQTNDKGWILPSGLPHLTEKVTISGKSVIWNKTEPSSQTMVNSFSWICSGIYLSLKTYDIQYEKSERLLTESVEATC